MVISCYIMLKRPLELEAAAAFARHHLNPWQGFTVKTGSTCSVKAPPFLGSDEIIVFQVRENAEMKPPCLWREPAKEIFGTRETEYSMNTIPSVAYS